MADAVGYPQIPSNVWWGLRSLLKRRPTIKVDEMLLASDLGVQLVAARQYLKELKRARLLDEDGKPTDVANKWRNDDTYQEAVEAILSEVYPDSLRLSAPPGEATRAKVVNWFTLQGLGTGAAGNKAATYLLISSSEPLELGGGSSQKPKTATAKIVRETVEKNQEEIRGKKTTKDAPHVRREVSMPLNINVQVHISADASNDQIESIFKSMRRYLYDDQTS
jgi:Family of unknown function (DUF5343)